LSAPKNPWVKRSLELANSQGYLDRLAEIYPATVLPRRPLDEGVREKLKALHQRGDWSGLLNLLLKLTDEGHPFPIEHPYASIFRQKRELVRKNPETVRRLGEIILSMPVEDVVRGCERPADINRVMGSAFQNWLRRAFPSWGIPVLPEPQFETYQGLCFLDARNTAIQNYVTNRLGVKLERGRDFLAKVRGGYVVGEARFLSTSGGSQTRDLLETISFIKTVKGGVQAVGVMDGIVWFNRKYVRVLSELGEGEVVLTALLLKDFLKSLG
jgi:hypothetical protein